MICNYSSTLIVNELAGSSFLHMWKVVEVHSMSEVKAGSYIGSLYTLYTENQFYVCHQSQVSIHMAVKVYTTY